MNDIVKTTDCIIIDNNFPLSRRQRRALTLGQRKAEQKIGPSSGVVLALGAAFAGGHAQAATFTVTNLADAGGGSLRQAILDANSAAGADTITFQAGLTGTITLTTGQLAITDSVDIQGPGAATITVSGGNASRVFYLYNGSATLDVTISGLTITGGNANIGAGIVDFDENLTLDNVTITGNTASGDGGGLWADGFNMNLTIRNSTISGNTSGDDGGGIYVEDTGGPLLIQNTVISGNQAAGSGGGIYFYDPDDDVTIENCTISGNTAGSRGGGIYLYSPDNGAFTIRGTTISGNSAATGGGVYLYSPDHGGAIENSTISGNRATAGNGGGIVLYNLYNFEIRHTTIAGNSAAGTGGGLFIENGQLPLLNSLVGDNTAGANNDLGNGIEGSFDLTFTLVESPGTATINDNGGNIFNQDPQLGALANNGGPTQTHLPAGASPAVNAGDPAFAPPPSTDQRGLPRVANGRIDMGAVEIAGAVTGPGGTPIPTLGDYAKMLMGGLLAAAMAWVLPRRRRVNLLLLLPALALVVTGGGIDSASAAQGEGHKHQNEKTGTLARIEQTGERVAIVLADGTTVEIATDDVKVKDNDKSKAKSDRNQGLRVLQAAQAAGEPVTVKIEYDTAGTARKVKLIVGGQTP
ncbi:MAG: right-handed parallel beta-helix repeat-containing protein [Candidatus Contendobacter sp.]|nr:right-handed parallel beta-helix repeat-containing protein [Candidatus Contendobacter sp.]MDS4056960.1 right-handed parallel beta-helix repeat-containing protein [Candidatus Contendobacter sp.]